MNDRVIVVHGWGGTPEEGWRPWLKTNLTERGYDVQIPAMPNSDHPKLHEWLQTLKDTGGSPNEHCHFIGHSLGCIATLRYLETLQAGRTVGTVVLLASFFEDLGPRFSELKSFVESPVNWDKIRSVAKRFVVVHSEDDTVVPIEFAERLADRLGVPLTLKNGFLHFSGDDGLTEIPFILDEFPPLKANS